MLNTMSPSSLPQIYSNDSQPLICSPLPENLSLPKNTLVYKFFVDIILLSVVLLVGIVGNIVSFLVLTRDSLRSSSTTNLILRFLAICDTAFLVCCFFFQFLKTISIYAHWIAYYNFSAYLGAHFLYGTGMFIRMMRNWTVVLVSLERWVAVCKPLKAPQLCTRKNARKAIMVVILGSFLISSPNYLLTTVKIITSNCTGVRYNTIELHEFVKKNQLLEVIYRYIFRAFLTIGLPLLILCTLNCLLIRGVKRAMRKRSNLTTTMYAQAITHSTLQIPPTQSTLTLPHLAPPTSLACPIIPQGSHIRNVEVTHICIGVIVVFIICETPAAVYQMLIHLQMKRFPFMFWVLTTSNFLVSLNSAVNFFIYVFLGKRFRRYFVNLLCSMRPIYSPTTANIASIRDLPPNPMPPMKSKKELSIHKSVTHYSDDLLSQQNITSNNFSFLEMDAIIITTTTV